MRLREQPDGAHRLTVAAGSAADGSSIDDLDQLPDDAWISFLVRAGRLIPVTRDTTLHPGDEALILADPDCRNTLTAIFEQPVERLPR